MTKTIKYIEALGRRPILVESFVKMILERK